MFRKILTFSLALILAACSNRTTPRPTPTPFIGTPRSVIIDTDMAALVFQSGLPVTLIPLDATNHVPVTTSFFKRLKQDHSTPEATFVFDVLTKRYDFIKSGGYYFWDPFAAAVLTDNSLASFENKTLTIIKEEGSDSGRTQVSENGASIRVAGNADSKQFEQLFLDTLNAPE